MISDANATKIKEHVDKLRAITFERQKLVDQVWVLDEETKRIQLEIIRLCQVAK